MFVSKLAFIENEAARLGVWAGGAEATATTNSTDRVECANVGACQGSVSRRIRKVIAGGVETVVELFEFLTFVVVVVS